MSVNESTIDINSRICLISGWIVDKQEKAILAFHRAKRLLSPKVLEKLEKYELKKFSQFDTRKTVLIYEENEELFKYISRSLEEFVELNNGVIMNATTKTALCYKKRIVRSFHVSCHPTIGGSGKRLFIAPMQPEKRHKIEMKSYSLVKRKKNDHSVLDGIIHSKAFTFTSKDYHVLTEFDKFAKQSGTFVEEFMLHIYNVAHRKTNSGFNIDFYAGIGSLVKIIDPITLKAYAKRLVGPIFLLLNGKRLSFFNSDIFISNESILKLNNSINDKDLTSFTKIISPLFCELFENSLFQEYMFRWIKLCAFIIKKRNRYTETFSLESSISYRYKLDAIKQLILLSAVSSSDDIDTIAKAYTSANINHFMTNFNLLYRLVVRENNIYTKNNICVVPDGKYLLIKGRILSFPMISTIKEELNSSINNCINDLCEWLYFPSPSQTYQKVFDSKAINIFKDDEPNSDLSSIFDIIPQEIVEEYSIKWKSDNDRLNENVIKKMICSINQLTRLLMFSVWISPGLPLRLSELSMLTFSGYDRNMFVDMIDKVFYFKNTYNKSKQYDSRLYFMDKYVTAHLLWFIYILRPFTIELLQNKLNCFKVDVLRNNFLKEFSTEVEETFSKRPDEEEEATRAPCYISGSRTIEEIPADKAGDSILKMFLFVDILNYGLISSTSFTTTLLSYPTDQSTYKPHEYQNFSQGLLALWKYFVIPECSLMTNCHIRNSNTTINPYATYKNDLETFNCGLLEKENVFDYYEAKILCQKFQQLTAYSDLNDSTNLTKLSKVTRVEHFQEKNGLSTDIYSLFEEGRLLYDDNFKFLSSEQLCFAANILMSNKKLHILQSSVNFGKTLTYILPILSLHRSHPGKYIHFAVMPYENHKSALIAKLKNFNLIVEDINILTKSEAYYKVTNVNILVGCFDDFCNKKINETLLNWNKIFETVAVGYFIINKAHTLYTEKKSIIRNLAISYETNRMFLKIIMLSSTFPSWMCECINNKYRVTTDFLHDGRYVNTIKILPKYYIVPKIEWCISEAIDKRVCTSIQNYLGENTEGKAIIFFDSNEQMKQNYDQFFRKRNEVYKLDTDMKEHAKTKILDDFKNNNSPLRVLVTCIQVLHEVDYPYLDLVSFVNCNITPIDYAQVVEKLHPDGCIQIFAIEKDKATAPGLNISNSLNNIDWNQCVIEQMAKFYGIDYHDHHICCNNETNVKELDDINFINS